MRKSRNGDSDFRYIRENNLRYVDMTEYNYRLLKISHHSISFQGMMVSAKSLSAQHPYQTWQKS